MHHYQAYGECLASELPLPELRETPPSSPHWTFHCPADPPPALPEEVLGEQTVYEGCIARLRRASDCLTITVDDTGRFDLTCGGRQIACWPVPGANPDFIRGHLLGRVLATAMHFEEALVLHGSAVSLPAGAVVFLAPKHSGKSTLALSLTMFGARLVSDDTIAVRPGDGVPEVRPGVQAVRLLPDVVRQVSARADATHRPDGKQLVTGLPADRVENRVRPLAAIYLLVPAESIQDGVAVGRRPVPRPLAAAALVSQGKVTEMLGPGEAKTLLERAARVVSRAPVYQLAVHHDFRRLPEVVQQLGVWHQTEAVR